MSQVRGTKGDLWEQYVLIRDKLQYMTNLCDIERGRAQDWQIKYWRLESEMDVIEDRLDDFAKWAMQSDSPSDITEVDLPEAIEAEEQANDQT